MAILTFESQRNYFLGGSTGNMNYSRVVFIIAGAIQGLVLHVRDAGSWHIVEKVWARVGGTWVEVIPYIRNVGYWYTP